MQKTWNAICAIAQIAAWIGGAMLFAAAGIVTFEIALRKGLGALIGSGIVFSGSDELSAYLFAIGTSWSMAYVLVTRGHIRIDAVYTWLNRRAQLLCDFIAMIALGLFVVIIAYHSVVLGIHDLVDSVRSNTPLRIPLAYVQLPWAAGFVLFIVALFLALLRGAAALIQGDYRVAQETIGIPSQGEEISAELEGLGISAKPDERGA